MSEQPPKIRYAHIDEAEVQAFRELGQSVLGYGWVYRLADYVGVSTRTAQRWAAGHTTVPLWVIEKLQGQALLLRETGLTKSFTDATAQAMRAGLSNHVVAAVAKDLAADLRGEPVDKDRSFNS
ncbi:hypothetical protein ACFOYU_09965 [Microvirga sp. GCM10011540]|uniref:hypothetical protein n=1 Tax=Microvirga sp. GCM10011540 TaxID=3317338 RepID=UPI00360A591B